MSEITAQNTHEVLSRHLLVDVFPMVLDLERSTGNRIYDAKEGRFLIDCCSFIASNPLGFNHPKMQDPAFEKRLLRAARTKPSSSDFYTQELAEYVDTFSRIALPKEFQHLFFIEGGALAVENAMKTAFDWKVRKNQERYGATNELGTQIIHFAQAFHGRSGYTLSVTNTADPRKTKFFPKFSWPRITNPKVTFPLEGGNLEKVIALEEQAITEIKAAFQEHTDDIAAILVETIQGEGGDNHFRPEFHQQLRSLADENEAMLIYDEVQCGLGLTGKMWAYEHYGIVPDIVCFGKKTQVCGIMVGPRVDEVENNVFVEASRLNSTWGGNLVDMVRSQRHLEIIAEDNLVENARVVGDLFLARLTELAANSGGLLSNAHGKGFMIAVDVASPEKQNEIFAACLERGAIVLKCGTRTIRFRPSLTFSEDDLNALFEILEDAVKSVSL